MNLRNDYENIILDTIRVAEADNKSSIIQKANGGNSIIIVCPPDKEGDYISAIIKLMDKQRYRIIDLNDILCEFISENKDELNDRFNLLKSSIHQVFKIPDAEQGNDLYRQILKEIEAGYKSGRIPVLINSGVLYGSGIDNINIVESEMVIKASLPLIVLYPATKQNGVLLFLGKRPASKYRCVIVE
jgi:hypothetical protein